MCLLNYNKKAGKYKHLTYSEKTMIERWHNKERKSNKEISNLLNKSERTIRREINRELTINLTSELEEIKVYSADISNEEYRANMRAKGQDLKIGSDRKGNRTVIYYAHPYCSGEKGTNEKHNSMIRYFIPKGNLIENYSYKEINKIASWMNNYPRKLLNYKTPLEVLQEEFNDKSILNKIYKLQEKINYL